MGSIRAQIFRGIVLVAGAAIAITTIVLVAVAHDHLHRQTDALLSQLARLEVSSMIDENHLHIHEMNVAIPGPGLETERFALVFDSQGRILERTGNLTGSETVPPALLDLTASPGERGHVITGLTDDPLRMVMTLCPVQGEPLYLAVGVRNPAMEAATRRVITWGVLLAVFAVLVVAIGGYLVARRVTVDLERVHRATAAIDLRAGLISGAETTDRLDPGDGATQEVRDLAATIRDLLERVREVCDTQSRFLAEAAHELRTPLTAIRGELELALRRERGPEAYRETLRLVLDDAIRLQELSEVLLDSARARAQPAINDCALGELVIESTRRHQTALRDAGIAVTVEIDSAFEILANRMATSRVLDNLIANAARWSGGHALSIRATFDEDRIRLTIADDGTGLPDALLPDLFTPFNRGDRRQGHGLGLYLAHTLMIAQGASLDYRPGTVAGYGGTTWLLSFPASAPNTRRRRVPGTAGVSPAPHDVRKANEAWGAS